MVAESRTEWLFLEDEENGVEKFKVFGKIVQLSFRQ